MTSTYLLVRGGGGMRPAVARAATRASDTQCIQCTICSSTQRRVLCLGHVVAGLGVGYVLCEHREGVGELCGQNFARWSHVSFNLICLSLREQLSCNKR